MSASRSRNELRTKRPRKCVAKVDGLYWKEKVREGGGVRVLGYRIIKSTGWNLKKITLSEII